MRLFYNTGYLYGCLCTDFYANREISQLSASALSRAVSASKVQWLVDNFKGAARRNHTVIISKLNYCLQLIIDEQELLRNISRVN